MRLSFVIFIIATSLNVSAQQEARKIKTMLGLELGPMLPINARSDMPPFIKVNNQRFFVAPVFSLFMKNNLGFTITLQILPEATYIRDRDFESWDRQNHTMDGFYKRAYSYNQGSTNVAFHGGLSYKIESKRWLVIPRLLVGVIGTNNESYSTTYKLKDSHQFYSVSFDSKKGLYSSALSFQGGATSYYRFARFFAVSLGAMLHHQTSQYAYQYESKLFPTEETYNKEYNWTKSQFAIRLSAGASFTFPGRRKR